MDRFSLLSVTTSLALLLTLSTGCQTIHWSKGDWDTKNAWKNPFKKEKKPEFEVPDRLAVLWKDGVYENNGRPTTRGFGGRFYFYNLDNEAVKVDGELVVYGYDDSSGDPQRNHPDHKYVFSRETLQNHFSVTDLGPSYSVWIPWDEVGGEAKQISLIPMFKTSEGRVIRSSQSINLLPGRKSSTETASAAKPVKADGHFVQYSTPNAGVAPGLGESLAKPGSKEVVYLGREPQMQEAAKSGLRTTTFDLPGGAIRTQSSVVHTVPPMLFNQMQEMAQSKNVDTSSSATKAMETAGDGAFRSSTEAKVDSHLEMAGHTEPAATPSTAERRAAFGRPGPIK